VVARGTGGVGAGLRADARGLGRGPDDIVHHITALEALLARPGIAVLVAGSGTAAHGRETRECGHVSEARVCAARHFESASVVRVAHAA